MIEQIVGFPKKFSFYQSLKKHANEPRTVAGALIAVFGTFLIFSPSIPFWHQWYNCNLPFYKAASDGLNKLSTFEFEPSEKDYRQRIRTLDKGKEGFEEILSLLEEINLARVRNRSKVEKITNKRWIWREEMSRQFIDVVNIVHVYDGSRFPPYSLVATENEVRERLQNRLNRLIEGWGTALVILAIFWPYLWQGSIKISDWMVYGFDKMTWRWLRRNRVRDLRRLDRVRLRVRRTVSGVQEEKR